MRSFSNCILSAAMPFLAPPFKRKWCMNKRMLSLNAFNCVLGAIRWNTYENAELRLFYFDIEIDSLSTSLQMSSLPSKIPSRILRTNRSVVFSSSPNSIIFSTDMASAPFVIKWLRNCAKFPIWLFVCDWMSFILSQMAYWIASWHKQRNKNWLKIQMWKIRIN